MTNANRKRPRLLAAAVAAGALAGTAVTATAASAAHAAIAAPAAPAAQQTAYGFYTFDNANDPTFNQLLGINSRGLIAGYFGSGAAGHPNKGYLLAPPWQAQGNYVNQNFPGSAQTQVTGLNDKGVTVGFWSSMNNANQVNDNFGFWQRHGAFHSVRFPTGDNANPPVNQLLGVNNHGVAAGFYVNGQGSSRGYTYDINKNKFTRVQVPGAPTGTAGPSLTAAAINNHGDVGGFWVNPAHNKTDAFLLRNGKFTDVAFPGAQETQALGVNDRDELVGFYADAAGNTHGFTWRPGHGFQTVNDPNGPNGTVVNGLNNAGDLVGFYTDTAGNTHGFLAVPLVTVTEHLTLRAMPTGSVSVSGAYHGKKSIRLAGYGLTPGSRHTVTLMGKPVGWLTANSTGGFAATFTVSRVPSGYPRVKILNQGGGSPSIAQTPPITSRNGKSYMLHALESGFGNGSPSGHATLVFNPKAQTITVTLSASRLSPGKHAAHIHIGSCASQGPVQYMLMDFTANNLGNINHETRTVTGVPAMMPVSGWYLNLHQGNSNNILRNGKPSANFRPLLCANI